MTINVHQFKLDNEKELKKNLKLYFGRGLQNIRKFYQHNNYIYDLSNLMNNKDEKMLEVILVLYYLKLFSGISGESSRFLQVSFPYALKSIQAELMEKLNQYIQSRPINVFSEIYTTINSNITKSFIKNANNQLNDNGIIQFERFTNKSIQNGLYAQKIVNSNINQQNKNREQLNLGEISAYNLAKNTLDDRESDMIMNEKDDIKRDLALGSLVVINQRINKKDLADSVEEELKDNFDTISERLAMTETQIATETFRNEEIDSFKDALLIAGDEKNIIKTWVSRLDSRVRLWHSLAHGQEQMLLEPFIVNSQLLNFPGDMSLGASLNNIINCRCEAEYN